MRTTTMSQTQKLADHLRKTGEHLTPAQIKKKFRIEQPSSAIRHLRNQGHCIMTLEYPNGAIKYAAGEATPEMISFVAKNADKSAFYAMYFPA